MNSRYAFTGAIAAASLATVLGASQANAQNFTFTSNYSTPTITSGTSTLTIANGASNGVAGAPTAIVLSNLSEFTTPGTGPNTFTNRGYDSTFTLFDTASGTSQVGHFTGLFNGTADGGVGGNAKSALFSDTPTVSSLNFTFATGTYNVSRYNNGNLQFTSPGPSGAQDGAQGAIVTFSPQQLTTPEPGSVVGLLAGGSLLALLAFRRRSAFTPAA